jgi:large subunit ribosomal protein L17
MRHQNKTISFGRKRDPKRALVNGLLESLILYEKIETTEAKAKAIRPRIERMVTKAGKDTLHRRRSVMKKMSTDGSVKKLFEVIAPRFKDRKGGYTRIIKTGPRKGDGAKMAVIEFVS